MRQGDNGVGPQERVVVVTGIGGMGLAIARRLGSGSTLLLADVNEGALRSAADELRAEGYQVVEQPTDVSNETSVGVLAARAATLGRVEVLVHTAGVSPVQAPVEAVLRVDLLGTALMLDAFALVIALGGAAVFIASMAGTMAPPQPDLESRLGTTPTADLLDLPELSPDVISDPGTAYMVAKRANQVRVRAAALVWGHGRLASIRFRPASSPRPWATSSSTAPAGSSCGPW